MPNKLMLKLSQAEGFCCIHAHLNARLDWTTQKLANHLGVDVRSVQRWYKRMEDNHLLPCDLCDKGKKLS